MKPVFFVETYTIRQDRTYVEDLRDKVLTNTEGPLDLITAAARRDALQKEFPEVFFKVRVEYRPQ